MPRKNLLHYQYTCEQCGMSAQGTEHELPDGWGDHIKDIHNELGTEFLLYFCCKEHFMNYMSEVWDERNRKRIVL